jgi:hypothetical protein
MRVLIDSSAWVDFFNEYPSPVGAEVNRLLGADEELCTLGMVVMEIAQGLRQETGRREVLRRLAGLTLLELEGLDPYLRAAELYRELRSRGATIRSSVDCLLIAAAEVHDCAVLYRDRDVDAILGSGLTRCRAWPSSSPDFVAEGP